MNPTLAAAAWLILNGGPPPVAVPLPPAPVLDCQHPALVRPPRHPQNHLSIRWVGPHEYYDRGHRHHHHRGWRFDDQP